jgi:hypothetical protein
VFIINLAIIDVENEFVAMLEGVDVYHESSDKSKSKP